MTKKTARMLTVEEKDFIFSQWMALRQGGKSATDAADEVGVTYQSLHKWEVAREGKAGKQGRPKSGRLQMQGQVTTANVAVLAPAASAAKLPVVSAAPAQVPTSVPVKPVAPVPASEQTKKPEKNENAPVIKIITPSGCTIICSDVETVKKLVS